MSHAPAAPFTRAGILAGIRLSLPIWPSIAVFGAAFGAAAAQRGLTLAEAVGASALVYAGSAQMVTLEVWQDKWTLAAVLAVMLISATISARMILMGASLQSWLGGLPRLQVALNLFLITDANWLIGIRYRAEGGRDIGVLFGAGVFLWIVWLFAAVPGYLAGSLLDDPRRYGLDLVLPIYFVTMLVPLWKGLRSVHRGGRARRRRHRRSDA